MSVLPRVGDHLLVARIVTCCTVAMLGSGMGREAKAVSAEKFFKAPKASARPSGTGIYPYGDQMALGLYSIGGNSRSEPGLTNMQRAAKYGFNLAGPYYGDNWQDFRPIYEANAAGMKFTFQIREPDALHGVPLAQRSAAFDRMTESEIAASVREQVIAVLNDPIAKQTVARWTLAPEELRHWMPGEMRYLKIASKAIRDAEAMLGAAHRPMWMYEPGHRNADALKKTGMYQDIVSKGIYMSDLPRGNERAGFAIWSYEQILKTAKSRKTLPQAVLQLSKDFSDPKTGKDSVEIRRVLRHDAYLGLVMGMKGFNVWSMSEARAGLTTHNEQFQAYGSVAQELTGDLNLQEAFLFGEARSDLKFKVTNGIKEFKYTDWYGSKFTFDTLHYLNTQVGPDRYLFMVNSSEQPMDVSISGLPSTFVLQDLFAGTTTSMNKTSFTHRLDVLGVAALRLSQFVPMIPLRLAGGGGSAVPEPTSAVLLTVSGIWMSFVRGRRHR